MNHSALILSLHSELYLMAFYDWQRLYSFGLGPSDEYILMICAGGEI